MVDRYLEEFGDTLIQWKVMSMDDPHAAFAVAERGVDLAGKIGAIAMSRALRVMASAFRSVADYAKAEEYFEKSLELVVDTDLWDMADIYRRIAYLRSDQCRWAEALDAADKAISYAEGLDEHVMGTTYLAKGFICLSTGEYETAITLFADAITLIDPRQCETAGPIALHNLIIALSVCERVSRDALEELLRRLDVARVNFYRKSKIFQLKLRWAEGAVDLRFGINNKAARIFYALRREFRVLRRPPIEMVLISIDLAQAQLTLGDHEKCIASLKKALSELEKVDGVNPEAALAIEDCIAHLEAHTFELDMLYEIRHAVISRPTRQPTGKDTAPYAND